MKLWEKSESVDKKIDLFTVGNDRKYDSVIAQYDCKASIAHIKMLNKINLLKDKEALKLIKELKKIEELSKSKDFIVEEEFEDIHSKIEFVLTDKLGSLGKKIHAGRSRNDQVLVAICLYLKNEIGEIKELTKQLFDLLIRKAKKHKDDFMPGYTHFQIAMPSSFGMWFSAYAECLIDDIILINASEKIVDQNPLGSAAGYGSSFPIDRIQTTKELSFSDLKYNSMAAQMSRGKIEKITLSSIGSLASTLSKLSMDICLYMSQEFNFVSFPDNLTTGSSIMPHKKNPDVFELIRGKCNLIQSMQHQITLLTNNLPGGYHRDMQLTKGVIIEAIKEIKSCLEIFIFSLNKIIIKKNILEDKKYDYAFSVNTLNKWVAEGMPFRDAYEKMKDNIAKGKFSPNRDLNHSHLGSIGNLSLENIENKMYKFLNGLS